MRSPAGSTVPSGNCHLRGWLTLSEMPQPLRFTSRSPELYSSIQSNFSFSGSAMISLMYTPPARFDCPSASSRTKAS